MDTSPTSSRASNNHFLSSLSLGLVQSPIQNTMFDYSNTKTTQDHDSKHTHLRLLDHIRSFDDSNFERRRYTGIDTKGEGEEDSGVCTPPLWRSRPPESPPRRHLHYRSLSPASRTQAIERGQMELMEMVRNMPESCFELSLKDLVELPMARQDNFLGHSGTSTTNGVKNPGHSYRTAMRGKGGNRKLDGNRPRMVRSGSLDSGGFLLKMVFPIYWGQSKKKKDRDRDGVVGTNKASLRPALPDGALKSGGGSGGGGGGGEKDWWKKSNSICGDSESGDSSLNTGSMKSSGSSSSSSRSSGIGGSRRQQSGGCWSFILPKKANFPMKIK